MVKVLTNCNLLHLKASNFIPRTPKGSSSSSDLVDEQEELGDVYKARKRRGGPVRRSRTEADVEMIRRSTFQPVPRRAAVREVADSLYWSGKCKLSRIPLDETAQLGAGAAGRNEDIDPDESTRFKRDFSGWLSGRPSSGGLASARRLLQL